MTSTVEGDTKRSLNFLPNFLGGNFGEFLALLGYQNLARAKSNFLAIFPKFLGHFLGDFWGFETFFLALLFVSYVRRRDPRPATSERSSHRQTYWFPPSPLLSLSGAANQTQRVCGCSVERGARGEEKFPLPLR